LLFATNASEKMRIAADGNVGIGTDSPERLLSLYSDNAETTPRLLIEQDGTGDAVMAFSLTSGQGWSMGIDNSGGDAFMIHNSAGGVDSSSQFVILNSGNVGIGTTSPVAKLHVYQNDTEVDTEAGVTIEQDGTGDAALSFLLTGTKRWKMGIDNNDSDKFKISDSTNLASNNKLTIDTSGNVGIGTTSPNAKLHVEGNVLIDAYNQGEDNGLFFREGFLTIDQPSITVWDMSNAGASPDGLSINSNDGIRFRENGGEVARFKDGNFGIGTTSPSHKLEVGLTSSVALTSQPAIPLMISNDGNSVDGRVLLQVKHDTVNTAGAIAAGFQMTAAAVTSGTASYYDSLIFLESAGSGSETVHSAPKNIEFYVNNYNTAAGAGTSYQALGNLAFELQADGDAIFYDNVGIGTTSPGAKLEVSNGSSGFAGSYNGRTAAVFEGSNSAGTTISIMSPDTGYSGIFFGNNTLETYGQLAFDHVTNSFKFLNGGGSERMRITSAGAIKFNAYDSTNNTGTPTYLLGTDASGNVVKTLSTPSPITSQAASLYDLIPNGAFTTTYAFTSTAGTYAEVMSGNDVITANGTYSVQMFVNDHAVGGTQYSETYSGVMSWGNSTSTNDTGIGAVSEIALHRSGHAANTGITYLRTRETISADNNELKLEIMSNKTYTGASNVVFKFVRLI